MLKVGIISRHAYFNYGSCLQAYALQRKIEDLGYAAEYINYIRNDEDGWKVCLGDLKESRMNRNIASKLLYIAAQLPSYFLTKPIFYRAHKKYLHLSKKVTDRKKLPVQNYDILCTGSDQVWNRIHNEIEKAYFFDGYGRENKLISYAASFGKDFICPDDIDQIVSMLRFYSSITVRETSGVNILKRLNIQARQVVDPVLLYDSDFWGTFASEARYPKKKYILVYQLHFSNYLEECIAHLQTKHNLDVLYMCNDYKKIIKNCLRKKYKFIFLPSVEEFVSCIQHAEYVVTDSFHGTVFSLIFGRNFVDVLPDTNTARNKDLLKLVGLEDRIITDSKNMEILSHPIDYKLVSARIYTLRSQSEKQLISMLGGER